MLKKGELPTFEALTQKEHDTLEAPQDRLVPVPVLTLPGSNGFFIL